ncbi:dtw domain-containing protein 2 [Pitangus sulphuratus]|nr:dtw domain-containing protein 2 [Pitangus sulphuratus]
MGEFNQPSICWRDNTAGGKQSRRFLEFMDANSLLQVTEELMRRGAVVDLVLTNKEGLVGNVKLKGSLGCSDHKMVELKILRAVRRVHSNLVILDFRSADFGLIRELLEYCGIKPGGKRGPGKLVNVQELTPPNACKSWKPAWMTRMSWTNSNTIWKATEHGSKDR